MGDPISSRPQKKQASRNWRHLPGLLIAGARYEEEKKKWPPIEKLSINFAPEEKAYLVEQVAR